MFTKAVDEHGEETPVFVVNPMTALLVQLMAEERLELERGQKYAGEIIKIVEFGLANCEDRECQSWITVSPSIGFP